MSLMSVSFNGADTCLIYSGRTELACTFSGVNGKESGRVNMQKNQEFISNIARFIIDAHATDVSFSGNETQSRKVMAKLPLYIRCTQRLPSSII